MVCVGTLLRSGCFVVVGALEKRVRQRVRILLELNLQRVEPPFHITPDGPGIPDEGHYQCRHQAEQEHGDAFS